MLQCAGALLAVLRAKRHRQQQPQTAVFLGMYGHLILSAAGCGAAHGPQSCPLTLSTVLSRVHLCMIPLGKKKQTGRLQKVLREQKARLYIIRRCVVMLLCWSD
ncbi:hypothetical protein D1007_00954 [Hordeum vulgare]|nr:hypothetical protein D1007_00954 [Hordeum vulgare]